jgi:hypothetical protein
VAPEDAATLYRAACAYALTAAGRDDDYQEAFRLLGQSLQRGYGWDQLGGDDDLGPLRDDPWFQDFVKAGRALRAAGGR